MSPSQRPLNEKPFLYAMSLIEGKWKLHILFWLCREGTLRYGELKRALPGITHKMLSAQLKELERDSLVIRREYPQVPPKVEYRLSRQGHSLIPLLIALSDWGADHLPEDWGEGSSPKVTAR